MIKVNVIVKNKTWLRFINNPEAYLKKKIKKIQSDKFFRNKKYCFSLKLSNTNEIKLLNKKFRKKNKSTDVLSFPFYVKKDLKKKIRTEKEIYLGDIIININKIKNKRDKKIFRLELDKLWIHGLAHLLGYDHRKNKDFEKMIKIEKKFLSYL